MQLYEIHIHGFADTEAALALQEPLARLLCPVEDHDGPCEVPWGFTVGDGSLVLGIYASAAKAAEVTDRVRSFVGGAHRAVLGGPTSDVFDELVAQYRVEHPAVGD
ncbi:hypothetical protein [Streptomyces sp. NRRL B-1347]|uniref:hypothetical protein n=1 Tax=Streptomyces sp. NRRL B-1347 TaxID=1476877 RepID=UPI0004C61990|nr:hypothetical protein [Streptomyces sp. NRRL B-1347]